MTPPIMNSGRALPLPPKGINVNRTNLHGLAVGPQPRPFSANFALRCKKGPMETGASKILYRPHRQEARHG